MAAIKGRTGQKTRHSAGAGSTDNMIWR